MGTEQSSDFEELTTANDTEPPFRNALARRPIVLVERRGDIGRDRPESMDSCFSNCNLQK